MGCASSKILYIGLIWTSFAYKTVIMSCSEYNKKYGVTQKVFENLVVAMYTYLNIENNSVYRLQPLEWIVIDYIIAFE